MAKSTLQLHQLEAMEVAEEPSYMHNLGSGPSVGRCMGLLLMRKPSFAVVWLDSRGTVVQLGVCLREQDWRDSYPDGWGSVDVWSSLEKHHVLRGQQVGVVRSGPGKWSRSWLIMILSWSLLKFPSSSRIYLTLVME